MTPKLLFCHVIDFQSANTHIMDIKCTQVINIMNAFLIEHHHMTREYPNSSLIPNEDDVVHIADLEFDLSQGLIKKSGQEINVTARQYALLERFVQARTESQNGYPDISCDT